MNQELEKKIFETLEVHINPYLALHQGGCDILDYEDGVLTIRLHGGCSGCPSSHLTLFNGILPIFQEHIPEIQEVVLG